MSDEVDGLGGPDLHAEEVTLSSGNNNKRSRVDAGLVETLSGPERRESVRRYLQAYSRDQLLNLLAELGATNQAAFAEIVHVACDDMVNRKLFVRGINWSTTNDALRAAFSEFGEVDEASIVTDKATGKSKGFGFVVFQSGEAAFAALARRNLVIDGRSVQFNLASLRNDQPALGIAHAGNGLSFPPPVVGAPVARASTSSSSSSSFGASSYGLGGGGGGGDTNDIGMRKLFVRGLNWETTSEGLRQAFEIFGQVEEAAVVTDKATQRSKGFGFVTFASGVSAQKALEQPQKEIQGRVTTCNLASEGGYNKGGGGGMGGGGGGAQYGAARTTGAAYGTIDASAYTGAQQQAAYSYANYGQQQAAAFGASYPQQAQQQQAVYGVAAPSYYGVQGAQAAQQVAAQQQQQVAAYGAAYGYSATAARK